MFTITRSPARLASGCVLLGVAALHVAWGRGSTFPYTSFDELTDKVVGSPKSPSPTACNMVAGGLVTAAALTVTSSGRVSHRVGRGVLAAGFLTRAAFGFMGRTDVLVPGSASPAFRRRDRLVYAPTCAALAAGVLSR